MIAPAADLADRINTFYIIETGHLPIEEIIPAYSAQLLVVVRGRLSIAHADGNLGDIGALALNAPQLRAAPCVLEGPSVVVGVSLTPIGWQALTNLPVDEVHDTLVPLGSVLDAGPLARLEALIAACRDGLQPASALTGELGAIMAATRYTGRADHVAAVHIINEWLSSGFTPTLSQLYESVSVSRRQLQRISRRYYGVPPAQVLKRYRAIRAAIVLANPALPDELRDEVFTSYFDQAHLIRDIRRYTGRTPTQLRARALTHGTLDPGGHGDAAAFLLRDQDG
jgi:AraC-like DNA-binding protein